jgi:hypothetical protein
LRALGFDVSQSVAEFRTLSLILAKPWNTGLVIALVAGCAALAAVFRPAPWLAPSVFLLLSSR